MNEIEMKPVATYSLGLNCLKKAADNCSVAVYVRRSPTRVESLSSRGKHPPGNSIPAQFFCMEAMLLQIVFFLHASSETSGGHDKIKLFCFPSRSSLEIVFYCFTVEGRHLTNLRTSPYFHGQRKTPRKNNCVGINVFIF
jgi:hypothetical protein